MSVYSLNSGAEYCIQIMRLNTETEGTIRSCIYKYTKPNSFCEQLNWVVYRIQQAIKRTLSWTSYHIQPVIQNIFPDFKSKFGISDWQEATALIQSNYLAKALAQGILQENPQAATEKKFDEKAIDCLLGAENLLEIALASQQDGIEDSPELRNRVAKFGLDYMFLDLQNIRQSFG